MRIILDNYPVLILTTIGVKTTKTMTLTLNAKRMLRPAIVILIWLLVMSCPLNLKQNNFYLGIGILPNLMKILKYNFSVKINLQPF